MDSFKITDTIIDYATNLVKDLRSIPNHLADEIESLIVKIDNHFEFVKDGIDVRIESLRAKLDDIQASFEKDLKQSKEKITQSIYAELNIEELKEEIKRFELSIKT